MKKLLATSALLVALVASACDHPHRNHPTLSCIRHNESRGDYTAQNPRSSASGAYQFVNGTWRAITREMGTATEFSRAVHAPPFVQDAVAYWAIVDPGKYRSHWSGANRRC